MVRHRKVIHGTVLALVAICGLATTQVAAADVAVKTATLAPEGSVWEKALRDMGAEWEKATGGAVSLRLYAGGVAGDEPDLVRKMRIGQLHAAALSVVGLTEIDDGFTIFEIPLFFDSYEELYAVLDKVRAPLSERLEAKGFVLLGWIQGGWVHLFSKQPIRKVEDLKQQKLLVLAGNDALVQLWRKNGFQPVALATTDILTGLQTGMIEALPTPPLAALSLQWFRQTPYMQGLGLAPLVGGFVLSKKIWDSLPPEQQKAVRDAALAAEKQLMQQVPEQDQRAVEQMKGRGLNVVPVSEAEEAAWHEAAQEFIKSKRESMSSTELLDLARKERDAWRQAQGTAASGGSR